jgi:hypothetical protein
MVIDGELSSETQIQLQEVNSEPLLLQKVYLLWCLGYCVSFGAVHVSIVSSLRRWVLVSRGGQDEAIMAIFPPNAIALYFLALILFLQG